MRRLNAQIVEWFRDHGTSLKPDKPVPDVLDELRVAVHGLPYPTEPASTAPVVLPRDLYLEMFDAARRLMALLRTALLESAPDGPGRIAALGADEAMYPLFVPGELEERYATCMTRPDVVIDAEGPKFLEFNIGGGIGGVIDTAVASRAWKSAFGGAAAPFEGFDPIQVRNQFFARAVSELAVKPAVAVVGSVRDLGEDGSPRYYEMQVDALRRDGFASDFLEPDDLPDGIGRPGELTYPVGLRHFTVLEWRELGIDLAPVRSALDSGCLLLATQTSYLIANKKVMAWVSEGRPWMTAEDREVIARYLPWTRIVRDAPTHQNGEPVKSLLDLLLKERERFVIKPAIGMKSKNIVVGRECTAGLWQNVVQRVAASGDHVVQEHVESVPYRASFWDPSSEQSYDGDVFPVFGPFLFGGRPGGCRVRYLPVGRRGVVSIAGHGAVPSVALSAC